MNKRKCKELLIALHFALCLLALSGEPISSSTKALLAYYGAVLINLGIAAALINKHMRKYYHEESKNIHT